MEPTPSQRSSADGDPASLLALRHDRAQRSAVTVVPISSLVEADSPRVAGEDEAHIRLLADSGATLPPILVHQPSMRVVDGMHRLRAAVLRGQTAVQVRFFDGSEADVFLLSVTANTGHGLPLSSADRSAAALRIFASHPEWSDRMVASVTGLSAKKVAELRRQQPALVPQLATRVGRDGRARPLDCSQGRRRASELIRSNPQASLRQIARAAGISPATAADVRDRLKRGEDPLPAPRRTPAERPERPGGTETAVADSRAQISSPRDLASVLDQLRKDPSLRFNETGRALLRMLDVCHTVVREQQEITQNLPAHCLVSVVELSAGCADILQSFAAMLRRAGTSQTVQSWESVS
ncbi:ParB/RepB/Spo0J family partition protein [Kitasatospora sp. GP82]|uniref:ParB/RepB/Spo0J family partition protein n=1 Tax=Kitasatospora sp. GP82 TaxID=3035089 RepID=UPI002476225B|nr:ParB/RepB/Spo0J family partition protein [Kitasatospora sp. GP82]MDH6128361.1 ParB-like chromosome segregation protein Spo0J [Kitasatospora sp. GP82]